MHNMSWFCGLHLGPESPPSPSLTVSAFTLSSCATVTEWSISLISEEPFNWTSVCKLSPKSEGRLDRGLMSCQGNRTKIDWVYTPLGLHCLHLRPKTASILDVAKFSADSTTAARKISTGGVHAGMGQAAEGNREREMRWLYQKS